MSGAPPERLRELNLAFGLSVVVLIGTMVRLYPLIGSAFPLNDGGLFVQMATDLAANGFRLPSSTTYNGEAIPFAYPPLAFFLIAVLTQLPGITAIGAIQWLPAVLSCASILAIYLVASELLRSPWRGILAAAAFALMPRSYIWLVVGGGVTRSLGLLLALLAIHQGIRAMRRHHWPSIAATGLLGGLTFLAHPQAAVFAVVSILTLFGFHFFRGTRGRTSLELVSAGLVAIAVSSPWLIAEISVHGVGPLLSAGETSFDLAAGASQVLGLEFTDAAVLDVVTVLGVIGLFLLIARRQWMVPIWLLLTMLVDPRAGTTFASVPLALSVVPVLGELFQRMVPAQGSGTSLETSTIPRLVRAHPAAAVLAALLLFAALRTASRITVDPELPLHGMQPDHVDAMKWVSANAEEDAVFAVVTDRYWDIDYVSEWFPVLADRRSAATVQGSEWTGLDAFIRRLAMHRQLQRCARGTDRCLEEWVEGWHVPITYVFLPKGKLAGPQADDDCCPALRETLSRSPEYDLVFDGPGASIFAPIR